jgi:tetratricopeptide (TPR) repeat protein
MLPLLLAAVVSTPPPEAAPKPAAAASDAGAAAKAVETPDCTGERATAEVKALADEAKAQQQAKKYAEAAATWQKALALQPSAAFLLEKLGSAQAKLSQPEAALGNYQAFIKACPRHPDAPKVTRLVQEYQKALGP